MSDRLEIKLKTANNQPVSLKSMSAEALDSFMTVLSSLKSIVLSIDPCEKLVFIISQGSAICAVEAPTKTMNIVYKEVDLAIKGESSDKDVTLNLRRIQEQLKRKDCNYEFLYKKFNHKDINLQERLVSNNRIITKRKKNLYEYKLIVKSGILNQIGGKIPNYHFDYGDGVKITIDCTKDQAMSINQHLYQNVNSLLVCKEWSDSEKSSEYYHKLILGSDLLPFLMPFLREYNHEENLVGKLTLIHDFIDNSFRTPNLGFEMLKYLLIGFNDKNLHLSELKTLLIISKPLKEHETIKKEREALLQTYNLIKRK